VGMFLPTFLLTKNSACPFMKQPIDKTVVDQVKALADPILSSMGLELVDVEQKGGSGRTLLRIYIDKAGGVSLLDCQEASTYLGHALDVDDPIPFSYTLEVSSPGIDRPFKGHRDYRKALGKLIQVKLNQPLQGQWSVRGRLVAVEEESITIEQENEEPCKISFGDIRQARLELKW
jgi:ribosome maturation factor RimP